MSASPNRPEEEWGQNLPVIPSSTGVFWPSIGVGILCAILGLYLILTPPTATVSQRPEASLPTARPLAPTSNPLARQDGDTIQIDLALVDSKDSTFSIALRSFADEVERRSDHSIEITLLPGGIVGGKKLAERDLIEMVRTQKLAMALVTTSPLTNFNHDLDIFDLPFLFKDFKHVDRVLEGPTGERLLNSLDKHNLKGLAYFEVGFRIFSSSIPLPDFESFHGKKLRVMESVTLSRFIKAIGGEAVPSAVDKIYQMGKEGYIDGAGRTYPTYWDFRLYEVHRFISETRHAYSVKMLLIDETFFDSLSSEQSEILAQAARNAATLQRQMQREADESVKRVAIDEGIKIFEITDHERKKFVDASRELYEEYRKNQSDEILTQVLNSANVDERQHD